MQCVINGNTGYIIYQEAHKTRGETAKKLSHGGLEEEERRK